MATRAFPENVVLGIAARLPVKSIGRFKSVCKLWRHLFSTPEFLKLHQRHFSSDPKNQSIIVHRSYNKSSDVSFVNIDSSAVKPSVIDYRDGDIVGCCNGIVCVSYGRVIVLLNPATMMFSKVPPSSLESCGPYFYERLSLGFGYDAGADDFKVVRFFRLKKQLNQRQDIVVYDDGVEVYSSSSGSWTTIAPGFQFIKLKSLSQFIVNGNPYWVAEVCGYDDYAVLLCFDVSKMVFRIVHLGGFEHDLDPQFVEGKGSLSLGGFEHDLNPQFVEWKGSLGALVTTKNDDDDGERRVVKSIDVWVFDDGEQIWRKNHTFAGPSEMNVNMFLECSKNGKFVGECADGRFFVFDKDTGFVNVVCLYNGAREPECVEIYLYTESLAYIKGMRQV
ncbi:hypothetical protein CASFOL_027777 [Castilleja foliolosa]|uniref:F-box domain-containing protein n=1 Tax=Castilleja foliolosa TaxID=1961234 RepID=A0ABD3CFU3_9LAMI